MNRPPPDDEPILPVRPADEWLDGFDPPAFVPPAFVPPAFVPDAVPGSIPDAAPASSVGFPDLIPASAEVPIGGPPSGTGEIPLASPASFVGTIPEAFPASFVGTIPEADPASSAGDSQTIPQAAPVSGVDLGAAPLPAGVGSSVEYGHTVPTAEPATGSVPLAAPAPDPAEPGSDTEIIPAPPKPSPPPTEKGMGTADPPPLAADPLSPDPPPAAPVRPPPEEGRPLFETPVEKLIPAADPPAPFAQPVAPPSSVPARSSPASADPVRWGPFALVGLAYVVWVSTIMVFAAAVFTQSGRAAGLTKTEERRGRLMDFAAMDGVGAAVVLLAWLAIAPPPRTPTPGLGRRVGVWAAAVPLFALLLGLNLGYHLLLRSAFQVREVDIGIGWADGWLMLLFICVQPAVFEELLCRHLMLGHLRPLAGTHLAVWVTAVLFACAHVGAWVSLPILGLAGVGLGYARVYSGGLALPVVLHFLHNLAVTYANHLTWP